MNVLKQKGYSILELIVTVGLAAILSSIALYNTKAYENKVLTSSNGLVGFLKTVRAKSLANTYAYTLTATNSNNITASYSSRCDSATKTLDANIFFTLPNQVTFDNVPWSICFTSRGLSDSSQEITLSDAQSTKTIQIVIGGAVRLL